ncbi:unnamed protein product [Lactuca saligna]|uniref:Uncharacterized protein n=1 Tax=Lactuca saligna TaxID=75948 RepID=A0AA36E797_LACSI|nr:unnamed protein product [Lactuca saligna]
MNRGIVPDAAENLTNMCRWKNSGIEYFFNYIKICPLHYVFCDDLEPFYPTQMVILGLLSLRLLFYWIYIFLNWIIILMSPLKPNVDLFINTWAMISLFRVFVNTPPVYPRDDDAKKEEIDQDMIITVTQSKKKKGFLLRGANDAEAGSSSAPRSFSVPSPTMKRNMTVNLEDLSEQCRILLEEVREIML